MMFHSPTTEGNQKDTQAGQGSPQFTDREVSPFGRKFQVPQQSSFAGGSASRNAIFRNQLAGLHRSYGNQAVVRVLNSLLASSGVSLQRTCACGGSGPGECDACKKENEPSVQRAAAHSATTGVAPSIVHDVLRSSGSRLDTQTRAFFEPRFGHDFSQVSVHTDAKAAESARAVNALAYTVGRDIVFGNDQSTFGTSGRRRLLAHELAHVVQQSGAVSSSMLSLMIGPADSPLERQADRAAQRGLDVGEHIQGETARLSIQRQIDEEEPAGGTNQSDEQTLPDQISESVPDQTAAVDESGDYRELSDAELAAIMPVAQAAVTPDGNSLGPSDPAHRGCLGNQFFFRRAADTNTTTAAQGQSAVTAKLGSPPGDAANCICGCGLFRQFIRGFWRAGSPTAAKQFAIGSCGTAVNMNEATFTEEFVNCITGGVPIGPGCTRTQADAPGFAAGLSEGTFVQMHLVLRYQMWDQCQGRSLGMADHVLDIAGSKRPRRITFT